MLKGLRKCWIFGKLPKRHALPGGTMAAVRCQCRGIHFWVS